MVFWDGLVAMASLNDWVRSRGSLAGNIAHHMRTTAIQFGITPAESALECFYTGACLRLRLALLIPDGLDGIQPCGAFCGPAGECEAEQQCQCRDEDEIQCVHSHGQGIDEIDVAGK